MPIDRSTLENLLREVAAGARSADEAARMLAPEAQSLGFATIDHDRAHRCGVPEVIYAAGKTAEQVVAIARTLIDRAGCALVTRATAEQAAAVEQTFAKVEPGSRRRTLLIGDAPGLRGTSVPIVTAGTSDEPVAEEAALTFAFLGQAHHRVSDVGVAGVHRLMARLDEIDGAAVIVCIAGMEGALPSVVGGLVAAPVIAVPTSVGYGAAFAGLAALLGMLTSCAAGVSVVNIDNGFGAAYSATLIQRAADGR